MLSPESRRQIVQAAVEAALITSAGDFVAGRRHDSLTDADRSIVGDLARRLAARSQFVQRVAPRDLEHASATFAFAFGRAYVLHLADLSAGRQRDAEQLAADVLAALDTPRRGQ